MFFIFLYVYKCTFIHMSIYTFISQHTVIQYRSSQILPETGSPVSSKDHHVQSWEIPGEKGRSGSCHASTAPLSNTSNRSPIKSGSSFSSIVSILGRRTPGHPQPWLLVVQSLRYFITTNGK